MKLLGSTINKVTKNEDGEYLSHLEITKVVLSHCNIVNNDYQYGSRALYTIFPNKSFLQLLDILFKRLIFLKTLDSEFSCILNY